MEARRIELSSILNCQARAYETTMYHLNPKTNVHAWQLESAGKGDEHAAKFAANRMRFIGKFAGKLETV